MNHGEEKICPARKLRCGGCKYLDLPYDAQLEKKQAQVEACLGKFGKVQSIIGMEKPYNYRNKAIATFATGPRGTLICGIYEARSHKVIPVADCLLQDRRINEIIMEVKKAASKCRYKAYDEDMGTGLIRHVVVRRGAKSGQVSVTLVTPTKFLPAHRDFVKYLREACSDIVAIVQNINPTKTSAVLGNTENVLFGKGYIVDELCGKTFAIASRAFYQVNSIQTEKLYNKAIELAELTGKERVIDAYCGIGTIGLSVSDRAKSVLGIELNPDSVRNANSNARHNNASNTRFICGDAGEIMTALAKDGEKADVVFMDPPREGSTKSFLEAVAQFAPRKVIYISCNPETQSRDLAILTKLGYTVKAIAPVDMFPHTEHTECIVSLTRE